MEPARQRTDMIRKRRYDHGRRSDQETLVRRRQRPSRQLSIAGERDAHAMTAIAWGRRRMIRLIAVITAAMIMMMSVVRAAHGCLNNRGRLLHGAEARAGGVTGAQKKRGDDEKHLPGGSVHGR